MITLKFIYLLLIETQNTFAVNKYSLGELMGKDSSTAVTGCPLFDRWTLVKDASPLLAFKKNT